MNEPQTAQQQAEDQAAERKQMTLQERLDIIDYLRARTAPIVGDTKAEVARQISAACGVEVTSAQVDYLVASLPKLELGRHIQVGPVTNAALAAEIKSLSNRVADLERMVGELAMTVTLAAASTLDMESV